MLDLFGWKGALPRSINCGEGWTCLTWESLDLRLEEKFKGLLEKALMSLNQDCSGAVTDEEKSGEILAKASRINAVGMIDLNMEFLKSLKTCGIVTLEVNPASKEMRFNEELPIEIIAKDKDGNSLTNRSYKYLVFDEEIIGFDENTFTISSFDKEGKTWLTVYDEITKGMWSFNVEIEVRGYELRGGVWNVSLKNLIPDDPYMIEFLGQKESGTLVIEPSSWYANEIWYFTDAYYEVNGKNILFHFIEWDPTVNWLDCVVGVLKRINTYVGEFTDCNTIEGKLIWDSLICETGWVHVEIPATLHRTQEEVTTRKQEKKKIKHQNSH